VVDGERGGSAQPHAGAGTVSRRRWGGVHIIPIYGAKGYESRYIDYLSPKWMEMLRHTVTEAQRLDLGIDMTTGTGWCFGGRTWPSATPARLWPPRALTAAGSLPSAPAGRR